MLNRAFWRGRRVFVTGHTGFKGSWLCLWLERLGAVTTGYALPPPTTPSLFAQARVAGTVRDIEGDVRDYARLKAALAEARPEVVLHLAAQSVVKKGYDDPIETYSSNVMGTVNLLEAVRTAGLRCAIVNVTSDKCYVNREWLWGYREDEPMGGHDPYSNSKGCSELVTSAYRDSYFAASSFAAHGVALGSARAGNAIGGGDWTADQLIPDMMRAFLSRRPCLIRNPAACRPWQFVLEPLRGYLMLAEALVERPAEFASGWNFGPADDDARPVEWLANHLARAWGEGAGWTLDGAQHPHEARALKLDASRARALLRWQPACPLETGLDWIVDWYRSCRDGADPGAVTRAQIERYESLIS